MHYIINNKLIKTEYTAKPHTLKSKDVESWLLSRHRPDSILDFGCGKLRYSDTLMKLSNRITFVDSEIQLTRSQIIKGEFTSISNYVSKNYKKCRTISFERLSEHNEKYSFITCTNVLSAIPCPLTINLILNHIKRMLAPNGIVFFVNQYKNSYFSKFNTGEPHLYGYIHQAHSSHTYYGILNEDRMISLLRDNSFHIVNARSSRQICLVEAGHKP